MMLQAVEPDDFVLATNETHSLRKFIEEAFNVLDENIIWQGENENELGVLHSNEKTVVSIDKMYYRPIEVNSLKGNPEKAARILGWKPMTNFKQLVKLMTLSDYTKTKAISHL